MNNHLLPFAYTGSTESEETYQARQPSVNSSQSQIQSPNGSPNGVRKRPVLKFVPTLKRKMDSFNEKNDIKRRDFESSLMYGNSTIVDSDNAEISSDLFDLCSSGMDIDSQQQINNLPPSSPPLQDDMEADETLADSTITSPFKKPVYHGKFPSYSPHKALPSSETDFGIDPFNRFKNPSGNVLPSLNAGQFEEANILSQLTAKNIIGQAIDDLTTNINMENMELYEVPDEIRDLNNLVIFHNDLEPPSYQLYLTGNHIRDLMPSLFEFTKLNVLGLRQNKLVKLPPLISQLVNLTDLTLGTNRLEYLPFQILDLPSLRTFRAGPNPYVRVDPSCIKVESDFDSLKQLKYISRIKYLVPKVQEIPTMKNLCLNKVAGYDVSYLETQAWKNNTPKLYHSLIIEAITKGRYGDVCSECDHIVVEPVAEVMEWWDYLNNKEIPIRRQFCSGGCVRKYQQRWSDHPEQVGEIT